MVKNKTYKKCSEKRVHSRPATRKECLTVDYGAADAIADAGYSLGGGAKVPPSQPPPPLGAALRRRMSCSGQTETDNDKAVGCFNAQADDLQARDTTVLPAEVRRMAEARTADAESAPRTGRNKGMEAVAQGCAIENESSGCMIDNLINKAKQALYDCLHSEDEDTRIKIAMFILKCRDGWSEKGTQDIPAPANVANELSKRLKHAK